MKQFILAFAFFCQFLKPLNATDLEPTDNQSNPLWAQSLKEKLFPAYHKTALAMACPHDPLWLHTYLSLALGVSAPLIKALDVVMVPTQRDEKKFYQYLTLTPQTQDLGFPESLNHTLHTLKLWDYGSKDPRRIMRIEARELNCLPRLMGWFKNSFTLEIEDNHITSIRPLAFLPNLYCVRIFNNPVVDFSPLWQLPHLHSLTLKVIKGLDLEQLRPLRALQTLILIDNGLRDISPLQTLQSLEFLNLASNDIEDASPLENLPNLTTLYLDSNPAVDTRKKRARLRSFFGRETQLFLENASQYYYGTKKTPALSPEKAGGVPQEH